MQPGLCRFGGNSNNASIRELSTDGRSLRAAAVSRPGRCRSTVCESGVRERPSAVAVRRCPIACCGSKAVPVSQPGWDGNGNGWMAIRLLRLQGAVGKSGWIMRKIQGQKLVKFDIEAE